MIALHSTVGKRKTQVMAERVLDINPAINVYTRDVFFLPETAESFDFASFDYVVDAIDTVSGKIALIETCKSANVPVISAMGAGNKLDPTAFTVADISKTSSCPLARVMRRELKNRGITGVKTVYSKEEPKGAVMQGEHGKSVPASIAFVPSVMGLIIAGEVIKDLIKNA
jgi:tRNA A37 threonylcarbamoyladenosine dehydratase